MPNASRTPARRRATLAVLAVSVASLAGAGSAAALPIALPSLDLTPASVVVTTPGAVLTIPGTELAPRAIESQQLPQVAAQVQATVVARAGAVVPSVALPSVSTARVGSNTVHVPGRGVILRTPPVRSITTPSRTPRVVVGAAVAAKLKVKLKIAKRTPRIELPGRTVPGKTITLPVMTIQH